MKHDVQPPSLNGTAEPELRLLDVVAVILRQWKLIALAGVLGLAVAALAAALQPRTYTAGVVVVPSLAENDSRAQMLAMQMNIPLLGRMGGGGGNQSLIEAILRSRSVRDSVAERAVPAEGAARESVQRILAEQTATRSNPADRSVTIEVTATDPALAARLANHFPEAINGIATLVSVQTAEKKRAALEPQLARAAEQLSRSEEALRTFEKERGAPAVQEQARASVEAAAELQRAVNEQELRLAQLARVTTPDNPRYRAAAAELAERRRQLARATAGRGGGGVMLGQNELPDVKLDYTRLFRNFTRDEQIYVSLMASLAGAEADATQDLAVVTVLDEAQVPQVPTGPRIKLMLVVGLAFGLLMGVVVAFFREFVRRARRDPETGEFFEAWDGFVGDVTLRGGHRRVRTGTPQA